MIAVQPNGQNNVLSPTPNTMGGVGGPSASPPGGSPKRQRPRAAGAAPQGPPTFAAMQQQGMARPAPGMIPPAAAPAPAPTVQPNAQQSLQAGQQLVQQSAANTSGAGSFQAGGTVQALSAPLLQQVLAQLADPTQGLNEAAQSNFDRQNRTLGREFGELREGLNENMAARGLDASTIAASRLGQLGERQAEAQTDMGARVQEQLVRDRAAAMQSAIASAMGLRGQEFDMDMGTFVTNRDTQDMEFRRNLAGQQFGLDSELGRGRLALDGELGRGNLALNRDRLGFDVGRDTRNFDYQVGRDGVDDQFRDDEFDFRRSTDARDFDFRRDTDMRDFDYQTGRDGVRDGQFDRTFDRDADWRTEDNQYRDERDVVRDGQVNRQFDRDADWRADDNQYRDGRDQVGDERFDRTFNQNDRNFNTGTMMDIIRTMGLNGLPPGMLENIMDSLGIPRVPDGNRAGTGNPDSSL